MADQSFRLVPLQSRVSIGKDGQGNDVFASKPLLDILNALFVRVGGYAAPTNGELVADMSDDAGIEESKAEFFAFRDAVSSEPPEAFFAPERDDSARIEAIEAILQHLRTEVNALQQGLTP